MKRIIVTAGTAVAAAVVVAVGGAGTAAAEPDVVGKTYADAVGVIGADGGTPVITTRVGDQLPTEDCIVSNATNTSFLRDSGGRAGFVKDTSQVRVTLNCNDTHTPATRSGNQAT